MNRPEATSPSIAVDSLVGIRRSLERADFLLGFVDGVYDDDGPWARVHLLALVDSGLDALRQAIEEMDRMLPPPR